MPFADRAHAQNEAAALHRGAGLVEMCHDARIEQRRRLEGILVEKVGPDQLPLHLGERGVSQWLVGKRMTQADITAVCVFTFLDDALRVAADPIMYQSLATLARRCESLPAFQETRIPFLVPNS